MRTSVILLCWACCGLLAVTAAGQNAPNAVNFPDPASLSEKAALPDPLVLFASKPVTNRGQWMSLRRPELKSLFQHYMYGTLPPAPAKVDAKVERVDKQFFNGKATKREITLTLGPEGWPKMHVLLLVPNSRGVNAAPVFVGLAFCGNYALVDDPGIPMPTGWAYPDQPGVVDHRATEAGRGKQAEVWALEQTIDRGYAIATFYNGDVEPDDSKSTAGIRARYPNHDWGAIAAWAWGIHRVIDYLVRVPEIDPDRIAVVGHSRNGKAALLAAALDERVALVIPHQAGCGGTAPSRGTVGESVKQINDHFPHWFNALFKQFNDQPQRLPFDQHCLVALCAPRSVLLSNAREDSWANPEGQFQMLLAAEQAYRLVGSPGMSSHAMPPEGQLLDGPLAYYIRAGKHSMTRDDWKVFLDYADSRFGKPRTQ